jgi:putative pyruvate formate lyase activating enzyme
MKGDGQMKGKGAGAEGIDGKKEREGGKDRSVSGEDGSSRVAGRRVERAIEEKRPSRGSSVTGKEKGKAPWQPAYLRLFEEGTLAKRIAEAIAMLETCRLCPRRCGVNRLADEAGTCRTGRQAFLSSYSPHFGEEDVLVGEGGSGTIFFTHCNLLCRFCQNFEISHLGDGKRVSPEEIAGMMIRLQKLGCHNINFVSPSHVVPQILESLPLAIRAGLRIPLVYNTGGYDARTTLGLLDGIFDIYMPDLKFMSADVAARFCQAPDYPDRVQEAILEMHRQVGDLVMDSRGIAQRGLLVRHLVLPENLAGTRLAMRFLSQAVSPHTYVNVMAQYRPYGGVINEPPLHRKITAEEYEEALKVAREEGLLRLDQRKGFKIIRFFESK